ncbi:translation initiation factor IF-6 [Candidatus Methanocrinis natronophilus]|uniref:Translation initiation factor 6 n=1 Tax=Candidatus Methanocrinis natronophilus TaxID=3033396 RepID=A0ABT5X8B1_9EURY|nr:translation initiation factor IF-6 [Candidatus Methanocrinis natronophilus]MDF0590921.1 translation initiation factor IF-6 [Candidatus Methanocrinis natronophilus]
MQAKGADKRLKIAGSPLLGVFSCCTEEAVLVPPETAPGAMATLERWLGVPPIKISVAASSVVGSLVCANSRGFVLTPHAGDEEMKRLSSWGKVVRLPGKISAAGNVILANDTAALIHPGLSDRACESIKRTLGVDVRRGTVGGLKTVGMTSAVNNRGVLAHPRLSEAELAELEDLFGLPVDVGTVNFGSPLVGSGVLANSNGYVAGEDTTGPELGRIEDTLGLMG